MQSSGKYWIILLFLIASTGIPLEAQVGWKFEYISSNYSHWKHLGSGDTTVIARLTFSQTDAIQYYLTQFTVRPLTNHPSQWFIDRIMLWKDNGNNRFDASDTLITNNLLPATIPVQTSPQYALTSIATNISLQSNRYLFITALMHDWHDDDPDNIEIDSSASGPNGYWFTVVDSLKDLQIFPIPTNISLNPYSMQYFNLVAQNLPVTVHNPQPSLAEDDSSNLNMFFPKWEVLNGSPASRVQQVLNQEITAEVYLPVSNNKIFKLESVEFDFGFDNNILCLKEVTNAALWGNPASFFINDTLYLQESSTQPNLSRWHYQAELKNAASDTSTYVTVARDTALLRLHFQVIKPGISPIFLENIVVRDFCGIRYHPYQIRQNFAASGSSYHAEKADAWAKFVLGDYTYPLTKSLRADNPYLGDGRVTWEDLTLFANHIWLNSSSPNWYRRFDIASAQVHDPDELLPDDTTNFYDLLQMARNYYRTQLNHFAQKAVVQPNSPVIISEHFAPAGTGKFSYALTLTTDQNLGALYLKLQFDPRQATLTAIRLEDWAQPSSFFCYPAQLVSEGVLDLNLIFLHDFTCQPAPLLWLEFTGEIQSGAPIKPTKIEIYNNLFDQLDWQLSSTEPKTHHIEKFGILRAFPNPFNANVKIHYAINWATAEKVTLSIFDVQGRIVKVLQNAVQTPGEYALTWDGSNLAGLPVSSGIYFARLSSADRTVVHKLLLLR